MGIILIVSIILIVIAVALRSEVILESIPISPNFKSAQAAQHVGRNEGCLRQPHFPVRRRAFRDSEEKRPLRSDRR